MRAPCMRCSGPRQAIRRGGRKPDLRVVIDLEAAQSPQSRHRGIGRYSLALAREMLLQGRERGHEFIVALNGTYEGTVAPLRELLDGFVRQSNIVSWHATLPAQMTHDASD